VNSTNSGQPAQSSEATNKLFAYGTLLLDDVVNTLIDRRPHYQDATAPGWRVVRLPQRVYPGLVPGRGEANGKVFTDLSDAEWTTLDAFEDPPTPSLLYGFCASSKQTPSHTYGGVNTLINPGLPPT
jgi:gamma-glutamylcyclotransferase (GGCT)/AIG2-like uncharacterized protein YtfP